MQISVCSRLRICLDDRSNSEPIAAVLVVLAQLTSWMLFLAFGMERHVIRALARSLEVYPAGAFLLSHEARAAVLSLGSAVFSRRCGSLCVVALLLLVDLTFALFGRLHAQLQLLSLAFPAKMLATLGMLALLSQAFRARMKRCRQRRGA